MSIVDEIPNDRCRGCLAPIEPGADTIGGYCSPLCRTLTFLSTYTTLP